MPHLQVLQCPSCGANQTYDGGPEITFACQFCGTTIIVPEELRPKAPPQAAMRATDQAAQMAEVVRLARAGQKVEAVRLMRESNPGLGLKGAMEAVNTIAGEGAAPAVRIGRAARLVGCVGGLAAAIFVAAIIAFIVGMMYLPFRLSGSYRQALGAAQSHPAVIEAMGAPIVVDWWPGTGEISCGGGGCSANYIIPIRGSQNRGRIDVMSNSDGARFLNEGTWVLDAVVVVNNGPTIDLTAR